MIMSRTIWIMFAILSIIYFVQIVDAANGSQSTACGNGMVQTFIGEECDDGNNINGDGCRSNCLIESGYVCSSHPSVCSVCGNGVVDGEETCDDGNTVNSDGCSSQCQIETGYTCSGNPSNCSICGDSKVGGTEECDDGNLINGDGCSSLCKKENTSTSSSSTASSSTSSNSLCGNGKTENNEECDDGNLELGDGCNNNCQVENFYSCSGTPSLCIVQIQAQTFDKIMGLTFQISIGAGISLQFLVASLIGQSLIGMWVMLNCLQLMRYLSLFNLYLPKNIYLFLSYINIVNFQNQKLQNLYQSHINSNNLSQREISNFRYVNQGIESTSILLNCGDTFAIIIFTFIFFIVLFILCRILKCLKCNLNRNKITIKNKYEPTRQQDQSSINRSLENIQIDQQLEETARINKRKFRCKDCILFAFKKIIKKIEKENKEFMFNTVIRIGLEAFIDLFFSSVLNIKTITFKNFTDSYSSVVSIIWIILLSVLFCFVFAIFLFQKPGYDEDKINNSKYGVLLKDFKTNSTQSWILNRFCLTRFNFCLLENIMFLSRRILIVFVTLFIANNGLLQVFIIIACCLCIMILKILIKPYQKTTKNIQDIMSEVVLLCVVSIFVTFYSNSTKFSTSGSANILGMVCIILILWIVICQYICFIIQIVSFCKSKRKVSKTFRSATMKYENKQMPRFLSLVPKRKIKVIHRRSRLSFLATTNQRKL